MKFGDRRRLSTPHRRREAPVGQILRQKLSVVLTRHIQEAFDENQRRLDVLSREIENPNTFQGFNTQEIRTYKKINKDRTEVFKRAAHSKTVIPLVYEQVLPNMHKLITFCSKTSTSLVNNQGSKITPGLFDFSRKTNFSSADDHTSLKPPGLVNLGNSCCMNSVMQCLNCLAPLVKFFTKDGHLVEVTSPVSSGGIVANEVGAIFSAMLTGRRSPLSLMALKSKVGELYHQFSGCEQQDFHEFLMYLFTWMHEELRGRGLSALESYGYTLRHLTEELTSEHSVISLLFQGEHRHVIACGNCPHKSITLEPFTILSLSLPASGKCTLANLLENYYKECSIDYNCPKCTKGGKCVCRIFIQRLPPILILHLNRFENNISARNSRIM